MNEKEVFVFELFCIDPSDIKSEQALLKGLSFSSKLWDNNEPKEVNVKGKCSLSDDKLGIVLKVKTVDTSKVLNDYFDVAFILKIESSNFNELDTFRYRLLEHLKGTLKFKHIRILSDDFSTHVANKLYPEINKVENLLRRYLVKFFIQKLSLNWWEGTAGDTLEGVWELRKAESRANFVATKQQSHDQTVEATDRPSMGRNFAFF